MQLNQEYIKKSEAIHAITGDGPPEPRYPSWYTEKIKEIDGVNLLDAFANATEIWLRDYQNRTASLKGKYTPYEVISWVINDWRKEFNNE